MTSVVHVLVLFIAIPVVLGAKGQTRWAYEDQSSWPQTCRGRYQSPIDLPDICYPKSDNRVTIDEDIRYDPQGYNQLLPSQRMRILNNGHSVSVTVNGWDELADDVPSLMLTASRGRTVYQFCELHFHWAHDNTQGSEHSIAGSRKAMEMHLVHFNKRYPNKDIASSQSDGLLVLGVLFHEDTMTNPTLDPIVDQLELVRRTNQSARARKSFTLQSLLPPDTSIFYMYKGSLTTPPCSESVTWLIIAEVQKLGYSQLKEFQTLGTDGDRMREIQDRNSRPIYANTDSHCRKDSTQGSGYGGNGGNSGSGGYNTGNNNGYGNNGGDSWNNRPSSSGNGGGYGNNGRPPTSGYGSGSPSSGSDSWNNGRPSQGSGYGSGDNSGGYGGSSSGGYRPQGSQGWDQRPGNTGYGNSGYGNPGSSGYGSSSSSGYGNSGYGASGSGNTGYGNNGYGNRPDSGYTSGSRPSPSYPDGRPSYGQREFTRDDDRPSPGKRHKHKQRSNQKHKHSNEEDRKQSNGDVVFPTTESV